MSATLSDLLRMPPGMEEEEEAMAELRVDAWMV
jgi:hypothetical protein